MKNETKTRILTTLSEILNMTIGYIKAQIIMFLINVVIVTIGMVITGMGWWSILIAIGVSTFDLLPVVGSGAVFIPWTIIAIALGNTRMAICVSSIFVILVLARMILEPIILGKKIGLSPLITMLSSVVGFLTLGATGLFVGPIVASITYIIYKVNFKKEVDENKKEM